MALYYNLFRKSKAGLSRIVSRCLYTSARSPHEVGVESTCERVLTEGSAAYCHSRPFIHIVQGCTLISYHIPTHSSNSTLHHSQLRRVTYFFENLADYLPKHLMECGPGPSSLTHTDCLAITGWQLECPDIPPPYQTHSSNSRLHHSQVLRLTHNPDENPADYHTKHLIYCRKLL